MMKTLMSVAVLAVFAGCGDQQLGDQSTLRFGLVVQYAETDGFAPIAKGQEVLLAIQGRTKPALLNDYEFLDGTLTATDSAGGNVPLTTKTQGQFRATFPTAGAYTLKAEAKGLTDSLAITVVDQAKVRLARMRRSVSTTTSSTSCSTPITDQDPLPQLKSNQTLHASFVAVDANDKPLLAVLKLTFSGPFDVVADTIGLANGYSFTPTTTGPVTLTVKDEVTGISSDFAFTVTTDAATCPGQ